MHATSFLFTPSLFFALLVKKIKGDNCFYAVRQNTRHEAACWLVVSTVYL